ncbi:hypothetical protein Tco_0721553, partial [Tanacetum coccineum]
MASSTVTYTSVYSNFKPWRFQWVSDEEPKAPDEAPHSYGIFDDYVPCPEYPEYLVPSDDEVPIEDQPLPVDASPIALSSGYVADSDPSEEDPEENPAEYPGDGGDDDDDVDDDDDNDDDDDEEEEVVEHLASADSTTLPTIDFVPSAEDTKAFETNESAPTPPRSPRTKVPFTQTRLRRAWKTVKPQPPMTAYAEELIAEYASAPTPPSPPPSPLSPLSSPLPQIPSSPLHVP